VIQITRRHVIEIGKPERRLDETAECLRLEAVVDVAADGDHSRTASIMGAFSSL
jgi:hypothetical protein